MHSSRPSRDTDAEAFQTPKSRLKAGSTGTTPVTPKVYKAGDLVARRYTVQQLAGVGGMCTVYQVSDAVRPGQKLALKHFSGKTDPFWVETLRNEFNILIHLEHENLIQVFEFGVLPDNGGFYYTAEFIDGKDLAETAPDVDEDMLIDYIVQTCRVLEYVHSRGYIHYDIKPKNILVTHDGAVKLTDFGITALADKGFGKRIRGTPAYTAPEIITGANVDHRADLYSLGVLIYKTITGKLPFRYRDVPELLRAHVAELPSSPRAIQPDIPEYLNAIILRLLAKNPIDRFKSANEIIETIARALHKDIVVQPPSSVEGYLRTPPMCGRDVELKAVRAALDELADGTGGHIFIEGINGIGRTRLLREIHFEAQIRGYASAFADANQPKPFDELAMQLAAYPEVGPLTERAESMKAATDRPGPKLTLPDTLAGIVRSAEQAPVVLCIDDVQDASSEVQSTLERLIQMIGTGSAPGLLLVVSWRDIESVEPFIMKSTLRFRLHSLTEDEVGDTVTRMFGSVPAPEIFITRLMEATGGVPHAVVETVRSLVASGDISIAEGKWLFRGGIEPFHITPSLEQLYAGQVKALGELEYELALDLALIDRPATMSDLAAVRDRPARALAGELGKLERQGIIRRSEVRVTVANRGIVKALIASRSKAVIRKRHNAIANSFVGLRRKKGGPDQLEIARHFLLGGLKRKGLKFGLAGIKAGEVEKKRPTAVPVLELLSKSVPQNWRKIRAEILFTLAECLDMASDPEGVLKTISEYRKVASRRESWKRRVKMENRAAYCYELLNRHDEAFEVWQQAIALAKPGSPEHLETLQAYVYALEYRGRFDECMQLLLEAAERFEHKKDYTIVKLLGSLAFFAFRQEKSDLTVEYIERAEKLARKLGMAEDVDFANILYLKYYATRELDKMVELLKRVRKHSMEQKHFMDHARTSNNLITASFWLGREDEALQYAAEAESIWRRYGSFKHLTHLYLQLGTQTIERIGGPVAEEYFEKGLECARLAGTPVMEYHLLGLIADASKACGDFNKAYDFSLKAEKFAELTEMKQDVFPILIRADIEALGGNLAEARELVQKVLEDRLRQGVDMRIAESHASLLRIALLQGDSAEILGQVKCHRKYRAAISPKELQYVLSLEADFWFRVGNFARVEEILEQIKAIEEETARGPRRDRSAYMMGRLLTARSRFEDAEKMFGTAQYTLTADKDINGFTRLLVSEVELGLRCRNVERAREKLEKLEATLAQMTGKPVYYFLEAQLLRALIFILENNNDAAHQDAVDGMEKAKQAGFRFLEIAFANSAAASTGDKDAGKAIRKRASDIAAGIIAPLDPSIHESARKHLLSCPV